MLRDSRYCKWIQTEDERAFDRNAILTRIRAARCSSSFFVTFSYFCSRVVLTLYARTQTVPKHRRPRYWNSSRQIGLIFYNISTPNSYPPGRRTRTQLRSSIFETKNGANHSGGYEIKNQSNHTHNTTREYFSSGPPNRAPTK